MLLEGLNNSSCSKIHRTGIAIAPASTESPLQEGMFEPSQNTLDRCCRMPCQDLGTGLHALTMANLSE